MIETKAGAHTAAKETEEAVWKALQEVPDPEIPFISVVDLGIISGLAVNEDGAVHVRMTPTFSGCPALKYIQKNIKDKLDEKLPGRDITVEIDLKTAWSTNNITEKGRQALKDYKLTPPARYTGELDPATIAHVKCPHCGSENTTMNSPFGPTLCRAIHYCFDCLQGFEQFKPL